MAYLAVSTPGSTWLFLSIVFNEEESPRIEIQVFQFESFCIRSSVKPRWFCFEKAPYKSVMVALISDSLESCF